MPAWVLRNIFYAGRFKALVMFLGRKILFELKYKTHWQKRLTALPSHRYNRWLNQVVSTPAPPPLKQGCARLHTCGSASQSCSVWLAWVRLRKATREMRKGFLFVAVLWWRPSPGSESKTGECSGFLRNWTSSLLSLLGKNSLVILFIYVCVSAWTYHGKLVEVEEQLPRIGLLLPQCGLWVSSSDC